MKTPPRKQDTTDVRHIARALLRWFDRGHRDLAWRRTRDPYAIWLSEIMLQQTQVHTVVPYYERFLARFPTVAALAQAELSDVLALWAGLGYYRRARHLHEAARDMVARHAGRVPATVEELRALPGVGRYTAGAVASIAFDLPAPVVDGNVMRVLARVFAYDRDISVPRNQDFFWQHAERLVGASSGVGAGSRRRCGDLNQAIMEFGATVCTPASPACQDCPLRSQCRALAQGRQGELPIKAARKSAPVLRRHALVILHGRPGQEEVLLFQRPAGGLWEHMWEFPTVPQIPTDNARVLGLSLRQVQSCGAVKHQLSHRTLHYQIHTVRCLGRAKPQLPPCEGGASYAAWRWVPWPLAADPVLPLARLVHKLAAVVRAPAHSLKRITVPQ
jgi:A/G-specific adenine glycosylase